MIDEFKFRKRLKALMKTRKFSQREFARKTDIDETIISFYLTGKRFPTIHNLLKMVKILNCDLDYLLGLKDKEWEEWEI